jgi:hypothetical protein
MYKVGDKVVLNGFRGVIGKVCDGQLSGMVEVGGACVSAADVQPIEVWAHMVSAAKSDMRKARKEGSILIAQTRRGLVELTYDASTREYLATHEGRHVASGPAHAMPERLASVYQVEID